MPSLSLPKKSAALAELPIFDLVVLSVCVDTQMYLPQPLGCANKDLDAFLGPVRKFVEYYRIVAQLTVIPLGISNNW